MAAQIDTERVIVEVRMRETLWNPRAETYKRKEATHQAWLEVCEAAAPNYIGSSDEEKAQIEKAVQSRWKTARDAFMRCISKKSGPAAKKKYLFYNLMTFLEEAKDLDASEEASAGNKKKRSPPIKTISPEPQQSSSQTDAEDAENPPSPPMHWNKENKPMTEFESELLAILKANSTVAENHSVLPKDDQDFFNSLAPIINEFDVNKKLLFRTRIIELAMQINAISQPAQVCTQAWS